MQRLPDEVLERIISYLTPREFARLASCCHQFYELSHTTHFDFLHIELTERSEVNQARFLSFLKTRMVGPHIKGMYWHSTKTNFHNIHDLLSKCKNLHHLTIRVTEIEEEPLRKLVIAAPQLRTLDVSTVTVVNVFTSVGYLKNLTKLCLPKMAPDWPDESGQLLLEAMKRNGVRLTYLVLPAGLSLNTILDIMRQSADTLEILKLRFYETEAPTEEFLEQFKMCKKLKYLYFEFIGNIPVDYRSYRDKFDRIQIVDASLGCITFLLSPREMTLRKI